MVKKVEILKRLNLKATTTLSFNTLVRLKK